MKFTFYLLLTLLSTLTFQAQVGIGTTTPDASALLELQSSEKGFLPPRMDTDARNGIGSPADGLTIYNTDEKCLQWYNGSGWFNACDGSLFVPAGPISDCVSGFIPPFLSADDTAIVDVTNPITGDTWMDRNLGAYTANRSTPSAAGGTDCWSYGNIYQWGRNTDGHEDRTSTEYTVVETGSNGVANFNASGNDWDGQFILRDSGGYNWVDPSLSGVDDLWQGINGANNPCPAGYRVPTKAEWEAEWDSWDGSLDSETPPSANNNSEGAINSPLKLPAAGLRHSTGGFDLVSSYGYYWSSTVSGANAIGQNFSEFHASLYDGYKRAFGFSVRCLKDQE